MQCYIGTYTRFGGPGVAVVQEQGGQLTFKSAENSVKDPIFAMLSENDQTLFVTGTHPETDEGIAATYAIDGETITLRSMVQTHGSDVCHATLSADEKFLYVANYATGCITVFPVADGKLLESIQHIVHHGSGPSLPRQDMAHTHQCLFRPGTNELFVCDLGMDTVFIYEQDPKTGLLSEKSTIQTVPGMGPRHIAFASAERFYLVGELDCYVALYKLEEGSWTCVERKSVLPKDFTAKNTAAAIRLHDGKLYVSNRGHNSICVIDLNEDGTMGGVSHISSQGQNPRDFDFTKEGHMLIANQSGGGVVSLDGNVIDIPGAVCVCLPHHA